MTAETDRIAYLEECLRQVTSTKDAPPVKLERQQERILCALLNAKGLTLPRDAILAAMYWDRMEADWPSTRGLDVQIGRIRGTLKAAKVPIEIHTVWGVGYRAEDRR
jgi:DNA-binding response OmpR family regulator